MRILIVEDDPLLADGVAQLLRGAGYTDPQILGIVTLAVRALMTNYINNVNQTTVDIPSAASTAAAA